MSELKELIASIANSTKKSDRESAPKLLKSKDKTTREQGVRTAINSITDSTPAHQRGDVNIRISTDGGSDGPPMDRLDEDDGIGGGTRVDRPMQPTGTEKGRIRKRNVEAVKDPKKAQAMIDMLRSKE